MAGSLANQSCLLHLERVDLTSLEFILPTLTLATLNVAVIGGNMLVVAAVITSHKLRTVTNTFIVSLAVADLLVGLLVLPFSNANETMRYWVFGTIWCSVWLAVDVWLCTASILNLCAISLDRYLAISRPFKYHDLMTQSRARILVGLVWVVSFVICCPPLIGWNERRTNKYDIDSLLKNHTDTPVEADNQTTYIVQSFTLEGNTTSDWNQSYSLINRTTVTPRPDDCVPVQYPVCGLTADPGYIIYSALGSFYIPVFIMCFFYYKIYRTATRTTAALKKGMLTMKTARDIPSFSEDASVTLRIHRGGGSRVHLLSPSSTSISSKRASSIRSDLDSMASLRRSVKSDIVDRASLREYLRQPSSGRGNATTKITEENPAESNCDSPLLTETTANNTVNVNLKPPESTELNTPQKNSITDAKLPKESQNGAAKALIENRAEQAKVMRRFGRKNIRSQMRKLNKEKKAAKTVGIIVGCFILCWMPFFTIYFIGAFCDDCTPPLVFSIFFWLGYCNSAVNPCVYALFSKDFRYAFRNLLVCKCKRQPSSIWHFLYSLRVNIAQNSKGSDSNSE